MPENEWEQYGLTKPEWDTFSEEDKKAYRQIGHVDTGEEPDPDQHDDSEVDI